MKRLLTLLAASAAIFFFANCGGGGSGDGDGNGSDPSGSVETNDPATGGSEAEANESASNTTKELIPPKFQKKRGTIGISVLTLGNPFFKVIADNVTSEAAKHGYEVIVVDGNPLEDMSLLTGQGKHLSLIMQGGRAIKDQLSQ